MRGRFVTFEGGDGAGKSTQARALAQRLEQLGLKVVLTREPGGTAGAEALRALLLGGDPPFAPLAETLLHFAARVDHVARVIGPALQRGEWVVCDRFTDSTMAYQGYGQRVDREHIRRLTAIVGLQPELTIILDIPVLVSKARIAERSAGFDHYEQMDTSFYDRVASGFREIAADDPARCVLVNGLDPPDSTALMVLELVRTRLGFPA